MHGLILTLALCASLSAFAQTQTSDKSVEERLQKLEKENEELKKNLKSKDGNKKQEPAKMTVDTQSGGMNINVADPSAEQKYDAWKTRGGVMRGMNASGYITVVDMPEQEGADIDVSGFGLTLGADLYNFRPPNPEKAFSTWSAFRFGGTFGMNLISAKVTFDDEAVADLVGNQDFTMLMMSLSPKIGASFGLGSFKLWNKWRGAVVHAAWVPSYTITISSQVDAETTTNFNSKAVGFDFDFATLETALQDIAAKPHLRVSIFAIPKQDDSPGVFMVGLGMATY